jgi:hypothetical protein
VKKLGYCPLPLFFFLLYVNLETKEVALISVKAAECPSLLLFSNTERLSSDFCCKPKNKKNDIYGILEAKRAPF